MAPNADLPATSKSARSTSRASGYIPDSAGRKNDDQSPKDMSSMKPTNIEGLQQKTESTLAMGNPSHAHPINQTSYSTIRWLAEKPHEEPYHGQGPKDKEV